MTRGSKSSAWQEREEGRTWPNLKPPEKAPGEMGVTTVTILYRVQKKILMGITRGLGSGNHSPNESELWRSRKPSSLAAVSTVCRTT